MSVAVARRVTTAGTWVNFPQSRLKKIHIPSVILKMRIKHRLKLCSIRKWTKVMNSMKKSNFYGERTRRSPSLYPPRTPSTYLPFIRNEIMAMCLPVACQNLTEGMSYIQATAYSSGGSRTFSLRGQWRGHGFWSVSYTHLTLPTNREV